MPSSPEDVHPLASMPSGTSGVLALGRVPRGQALRLAQLGLRAGAEVTVLRRTSGGGRLMGIGTARIGLDRDTSGRLELVVPGSRR